MVGCLTYLPVAHDVYVHLQFPATVASFYFLHLFWKYMQCALLKLNMRTLFRLFVWCP